MFTRTPQGRIGPRFYWGYRAGGIAYGPRFRGIETALGRASGAQGVDDEAHAFAAWIAIRANDPETGSKEDRWVGPCSD